MLTNVNPLYKDIGNKDVLGFKDVISGPNDFSWEIQINLLTIDILVPKSLYQGNSTYNSRIHLKFQRLRALILRLYVNARILFTIDYVYTSHSFSNALCSI